MCGTPAMTGSHVSSDGNRRGRWLLSLALCTAVLAIGAYFRGVGLDWDGTQHLHPDERFLCLVENALQPVGSVYDYFDTTRSTLNPNTRGFDFYVYGDFPLIVVQYLGAWLARPGVDFDVRIFGRALSADYDTVQLVGRGVSAACDLVTLLVAVLIGRRLHGLWPGLLAGALYAGAVLPIQQAHFFTVDACATMCATIALWFAVRAAERARLPDEIGFGLALGLGLASKLSVLPVVLLLLLALLLRVLVAKSAAGPTTPGSSRSRGAGVRAALGLHVAAIVAMIVFRLAQPYAFLPPDAGAPPSPDDDTLTRATHVFRDIFMPHVNPAWVEQLAAAQHMQAGLDDAPPNHQWAHRTPLVFPWLNLTRYGLGWALGLTAWAAWLWALWDVVRRRPGWVRHVLLVVWVGVCFVWVGTSWVKAMRYLLPIYPALTVLAAWALVRSGVAMRAAVPGHGRLARTLRTMIAAAPAIAVLLPTCAWAFAFTRIYTRPVTRVAASEWMYARVPADVTLHMDTAAGATTQQLGLPNNWRIAGASSGDATAPSVAHSRLEPGTVQALPFSVPRPSQLARIAFSHVANPRVDGVGAPLRVAVSRAPDFSAALVEHVLPVAATGDAERAAAQVVDLPPVSLSAGVPYYLVVSALTDPLIFAGSTIATEGTWDDPLPLPLPDRDPWEAMYQHAPLEMSWEDTPRKRARIQHVLERADYVVISSNRFYGSLPRNPVRWPMTTAYYRALFDGSLGFRVVADFTSHPSLGPVRIDDQGAEEAFTVYDHPRVLVFEKTLAFDPAAVATILARADLRKVRRLRADQITAPPQALPLP